MKTVISGRVTQSILDDADLLAGIMPTVILHNGYAQHRAPASLPVEIDPPCPMLPGETGDKQRNWTMCLRADAVIVADGDEHLANCGKRLNLPVYEV